MGDLFGTFGIRGIANEEVSPSLAKDLGLALATYLDGEGKVGVGYDPRTSSIMLEHALISGITSGGCDVLRFGMVPTPALSYGTRHLSCDAGIMITASHNPPEYNGVKFWDDKGAGFVREKEEEIERLVEEGGEKAEWNEIGEVDEINVISKYRNDIVERSPSFEEGPRVVIDCANGAGSVLSPQILNDIGCDVVSLNSYPDGRFPARLPEPTDEHITDLKKAVTSLDADLGIAHDGDADRTIIVDENGEILSGDRVFAFAAMNYLREINHPRIITTVATSMVLDDVAEDMGGEVVRTRVGEPELIREYRENGGDLAGEENGGVIFPDWAFCRDGMMTAVHFIEQMVRSGKTVSEMDEELPKYRQFKKSTECPDELKPKVLEDLTQKFKDQDPDTTDGIRIVLDDGWFILRPSGTEPVFRCFSEAKSRDKAEDLADRGMKALKESIDSVK